MGMKRGRAFEVRRRTLQPDKAVVVHMRRDGGDGTAFAPVQAGQLGSPGARLEVLKENLIHAVAGRVGFE
jgi:hypothetical protein